MVKQESGRIATAVLANSEMNATQQRSTVRSLFFGRKKQTRQMKSGTVQSWKGAAYHW